MKSNFDVLTQLFCILVILMKEHSLFKDLKVLELASVLAGPAVGQFFAELGADVVKVENPHEGDVTRSWRIPGESSSLSAYFTSVNWGKRSIALHLHSTDDQKILKELIVKADMLIASFRPGSEVGLGLDYDTVKLLNPKIIYGQITGYGNDSNRLGYDAVIQAESGFMFINGSEAGPPQKLPVALIDLLAAHQLKEGMLLGYIQRLKSGEGCHISVSLLDAAVASLANQAANYLVAGMDPVRKGSLHPNIAPYGEIIQSREGDQIILAVGNDRQFRSLTELPGLEDIASDPKFSTNELRVANRSELFRQLQMVASSLSSKEFLAFCLNNYIPAGQIRRVSEATEEAEHLWLRGEGYRGIRTFVAEGIAEHSPLNSPPLLNQHRDEILKDWKLVPSPPSRGGRGV